MKKPSSGYRRRLVVNVKDTSAEAGDNEWPVAGDAEGAAFVGGGDEPEQQLGAGVVEGGEPDFVDLCGCPHRSTKSATSRSSPRPPTCSSSSSRPATREQASSSRRTSRSAKRTCSRQHVQGGA